MTIIVIVIIVGKGGQLVEPRLLADDIKSVSKSRDIRHQGFVMFVKPEHLACDNETELYSTIQSLIYEALVGKPSMKKKHDFLKRFYKGG